MTKIVKRSTVEEVSLIATKNLVGATKEASIFKEPEPKVEVKEEKKD